MARNPLAGGGFPTTFPGITNRLPGFKPVPGSTIRDPSGQLPPALTQPSEVQLQTVAKDAIVPIIYGGPERTAGLLYFVGSSITYLYVVNIFCEGPVGEILASDVEINDVPAYDATYAPSGKTYGTGVRVYDGSQTTVDPWMAANFGWTETLEGFAYSVVVVSRGAGPTDGVRSWVSGFPRVTAKIKGRKVYDPRADPIYAGSGACSLTNSATWIWTRNPALILADFLYSYCGRSVEASTLITAANVCDTQILYGSPTPLSEKWSELTLAMTEKKPVEEWIDLLRGYLPGWVQDHGSFVRIVVDAAGHSVDHAFTSATIEQNPPPMLFTRGIRDVPDVVEVGYTETTTLPYSPEEGSRNFTNYVAVGTGDTKARIELPGLRSYSMAKRFATTRYNHYHLEPLEGEISVFDYGVRVMPGDLASITEAGWGWSAEQVRILEVRDRGNGRWTLRFRVYDPDAYDTVLYSAPNQTWTALPDPGAVPAVTGLTLTRESRAEGVNWIHRVIASWDSLESWPYLGGYYCELYKADWSTDPTYVWENDLITFDFTPYNHYLAVGERVMAASFTGELAGVDVGLTVYSTPSASTFTVRYAGTASKGSPTPTGTATTLCRLVQTGRTAANAWRTDGVLVSRPYYVVVQAYSSVNSDQFGVQDRETITVTSDVAYGGDLQSGLIYFSTTPPAYPSLGTFWWDNANEELNVRVYAPGSPTEAAWSKLYPASILGTITQALTITAAAPQIVLNNGTSNWLDWNNVGVDTPTYTTRSVGTKLMLYDALGASSADYAIGIASSTLWFSVPSASQRFEWYAGTAVVATVTSTGINSTVIGGTTPAAGTFTTLNATSGVFAGAVSGITDLTTTGNTILGGTSGDTLNVAAGALQIASDRTGLGRVASTYTLEVEGAVYTTDGLYALPTTAGKVSMYDGHFHGGVSLGKLSDPYVVSTSSDATGSLSSGTWEVGITSLDYLGNESFAQWVTVSGVPASGKIYVNIVPIAGAKAYQIYLSSDGGSTWTKQTGTVTNTYQTQLTISANSGTGASLPSGNASVGEDGANFVQVTYTAGAPAFYILNLGTGVNSQAAFFFNDWEGINASFQSRCYSDSSPGSPTNDTYPGPASGGKTELDIAFQGNAAQILVGNTSDKELDFFIDNNLVMTMTKTYVSLVEPLVIGESGDATGGSPPDTVNYASHGLEFSASIWNGATTELKQWRITNNPIYQLPDEDPVLEIGYQALAPIWIYAVDETSGGAKDGFSRFWIRAEGESLILFEDIARGSNKNYAGWVYSNGVLTFRRYYDNGWQTLLEPIVVDNIGWVGIGMTPQSAYGALQVGAELGVWSAGTTSPATIRVMAHDMLSTPSYSNLLMQYYGKTTGGTVYVNSSMNAANAVSLEAINTSGFTIGSNNNIAIAFSTSSVERMRINSTGLGVAVTPTTRFHVAGATSGAVHVNDTGQLYGTALHNNSGAVTGTTNQYIASGTYTPTITNGSNVASSTSKPHQWLRVGNVVTVSGLVEIDPTSAATATLWTISLPIASNFTAIEDCCGCAAVIQGSYAGPNVVVSEAAFITANTSTDTAAFNAFPSSAGASLYSYTFAYEIL